MTSLLVRTLTILLLGAATAGAETLDRDRVLELAHERAAVLQAARAREDAAAGELDAARAWRHNPELELEAGPRDGPDGETWDRSLALSQRLDLAGRGPRIEAAAAARDAAAGLTRTTAVAVTARAARLHLEALHAARVRELAAEAVALHEKLLEIARRRHEAGETGRLEVHYATVGATRARIDLATAAAAEQEALTALADLLALPPGTPLAVTGELAWPLTADPAAVARGAAAHPELAALAAREREAAAGARLAGAARLPDVGVSAGIGREERADILHFGLSLGLPVFNRGGGERAAARARGRAAAIELEAARRARLDGARRAWDRHRDLQATLDEVRAGGTEAVAASARLSEQAYDLGEIPLDRVLLVQRENLDALTALADLRLAAALAALDVARIAALPPLAAPLEETP